MARYLDDTWAQVGKPAPFVVVEGGAGAGTLAQHVLTHVRACADALAYVAVDRSAAQREVTAERLAGDERATVAADLPNTKANRKAGRHARNPVNVVLANELLDNMAPRVLVRTDDAALPTGFGELWVTEQEFVLAPAPAGVSALARHLVGDVPLGTAVPLQLKAAAWVWRALRLLAGSPTGAPSVAPIAPIEGQLLVIDYGCATTAELVTRPMTDWLRGYRAHKHVALSASPLVPHPTQSVSPPSASPPATPSDITCDVAFDQLAMHTRRVAPMTLSTQADWLADAGIDQLTAQARRVWEATRADPTAATFAGRAQLDEANDLIDPKGFGAFLVACWRVNRWHA